MNGAHVSHLDLLRRSVENSASTNGTPASPSFAAEPYVSPALSGLRRPRADTMPSRTSIPVVIPHHHPQQQQQQQPTPSLPVPHASSIARKPSPLSISTRFRSGSLTLPSATISKAFGPSIFAWSEREPSTLTPTTPGGELTEESANSIARTLNILGLEDPLSPRAGKVDAGQAEYSFVGGQALASPTAMPPQETHNPLLRIKMAHRLRSLSTSATNRYEDEYYREAAAAECEAVEDDDSAAHLHSQVPSVMSRLHHLLRPRAISVGILDSPNPPDLSYVDASPSSGGDLSPPSGGEYGMQAVENGMGGNELLGLLVSGVVEGKHQPYPKYPQPSRAGPMAEVSSPYIQRAPSPFEAYPLNNAAAASTGNSMSQTPSRTLFVGNLDPTLSTADLRQIFSGLGPVESVKLLPDKECGFVHFATVEDAISARDEILHRMGGRIGQCVVRLGFGKSDPVTEQPTRALWIGNIPANTTPENLSAVFSAFGQVESARVLTHKNCGFVNFTRTEDAVLARRSVMGKDLFGVSGAVLRIGFAKEPPSPSVLPSSSVEEEKKRWGGIGAYQANVAALSSMNAEGRSREYTQLLRELGGAEATTGEEACDIGAYEYKTSIPSVPPESLSRRVDVTRLKEMRKRLDSAVCSPPEVEDMANECLPEIVELCSDYIGNTVIQRLFDKCSEATKTKMLERIAPHLAMIGIHKNGTWAAQKIIECARTPEQISLISTHLKPYAPSLLLDQFGNYVVQCTLKFGPAHNQYAFDAMVDRTWEIAQGRFGARAMRTCLESTFTTPDQKKQVAAAVIGTGLALVTNPNGTLLLSWVLENDIGGGAGRRMLAERLLGNLGYLCTHKLASQTVAKLIGEAESDPVRDQVVETLLEERVLSEAMSDPVHGVGIVHRALGLLDPERRAAAASLLKRVVERLGVGHVQAYKRVLDELGANPALEEHLHSQLQPADSQASQPQHGAGYQGEQYWMSPSPSGYGSSLDAFVNGNSRGYSPGLFDVGKREVGQAPTPPLSSANSVVGE
ncbi:uncharacterized protein VTP21DRAFT_1562 [Calcarisporiella thermophila]|uniref:uncharacterized protein n=1 Tax=Calcarisporiella thermophila TaxID=911321 RepID=UPI003744099C